MVRLICVRNKITKKEVEVCLCGRCLEEIRVESVLNICLPIKKMLDSKCFKCGTV